MKMSKPQVISEDKVLLKNDDGPHIIAWIWDPTGNYSFGGISEGGEDTLVINLVDIFFYLNNFNTPKLCQATANTITYLLVHELTHLFSHVTKDTWVGTLQKVLLKEVLK